MEKKIYDMIIIGAGPAGLSAALYAGRANLSVLVIEKPNVGSLIMAHKIDNYPGFYGSPSGKLIYETMKKQAMDFNVEFCSATFLGFDIFGEEKIVKTDLSNFFTKTIIIATGNLKNSSKKILGEEKFIGQGVSYCATCDGAFTKNYTVSLCGKGEEIIEEALFLTRYSKVINLFITEENNEFYEKNLLELKKFENVNIHFNSIIKEIIGNEFVEKLIVNISGEDREIKSDFVFLYLGTKSNSELYSEVASLDKSGFIITDENMKTNFDFIFAAGDIRSKAIRQVTTATSDGTIAALNALKYILKNKKS